MTWTVRIAWVALALALPCGAGAREPAEEYVVSGRLEGGAAYDGRAVAEPAADGGLRVEWRARGEAFAGTVSPTGDGWAGSLAPRAGATGRLAGAAPAGALRLELYPAEEGALRAAWARVEDGRVVARGTERWERAGAESPLMRALERKALAAAARGTVPADRMATRGNHVHRRVLIRGPEIFAEAARLIEQAEHEVVVQEFYWRTDCQASDRLVAGLQALQARRRSQHAAAPVRVWILVNQHFLTRHNLPDLASDVERAGLDPRWVEVHTAGFRQRLLGNLHTKAFLVDGWRALITSANVHDEQDAPHAWYETGFRVDGPAGAGLRAEFADAWGRSSSDPFPRALPVEPPEQPGGVPVLIAGRPADPNPFHDRAKDPAVHSFLAAFAGAQERIRILTPHLSDETIRAALVAAVRRGVRVELVLSKKKGRLRSFLPGQGGTNARNVKRLYRALRDDPAAAARLDVRWFSLDGEAPIEGDHDHALHAKYASIDGRLAIVGSSNLDDQAIDHSRELNLVVDSAEAVAAWDGQAFEPVFARAISARD